MEEDINYMPDFEEFLNRIYSLNPIGNADVLYAFLKQHLGKVLPTKEVLTFDLLCKRYSDYIAYIKPYNDTKDKQYIKKDKVQVELSVYLQTAMYNNNYSNLNTNPNDAYLFGI